MIDNKGSGVRTENNLQDYHSLKVLLSKIVDYYLVCYNWRYCCLNFLFLLALLITIDIVLLLVNMLEIYLLHELIR